jgi:hypothetical protein
MVTVVAPIKQICLCSVDITARLCLAGGTITTDRARKVPEVVTFLLKISQSRTKQLNILTVNMQHNKTTHLIYTIILVYPISSLTASLFLVS